MSRPLLTAFALTLLLAPAASAQELGLLVGRGSSDFLELGSPTTIAIQLDVPFPLVPILRLGAGYRAVREHDERPGEICDSYWPDFENCSDEGIAYDSRLTQWEIGGAIGIPLVDRVELRVGARRVRTRLDGESVGAETERPAGNFYQGDATWGTAYMAGLVWQPWSGRPIGVTGQLRHEELDFEPCPMDVGCPFWRERGLTTFEVGLAWIR